MAEQVLYKELMRQLGAVGVVRRDLARILPPEVPSGSVDVLVLLSHHGDMRMSRLAELLAVDMSVTSRHVSHVADRGWIERCADPEDKRSRILRLTPAGEEKLTELSQRTTDRLVERLADWSDDDVRQLTRLLSRLRASFDDCRAPKSAGPRTHSVIPEPANTTS